MHIDTVRRMTLQKVKIAGNQTKYAAQAKVSRAKLSEFLNEVIDYVPSAILDDLALAAVTTTTYHRKEVKP